MQKGGISVNVSGKSDKLPQGDTITSVKKFNNNMQLVYQRSVSDFKRWVYGVELPDKKIKHSIIFPDGAKKEIIVLPDGDIRVIDKLSDGKEKLSKLPIKYAKHKDAFLKLKSAADTMNKYIMNTMESNYFSVTCNEGLNAYYKLFRKFPDDLTSVARIAFRRV